MTEWMRFCQEMGLGVTLAVGVFVAFILVLKWILAISEKQLDRMEAERKIAYQIMDGFRKGLDDHTAQAREFHNQVTEAHRFQKLEHEKSLELLYKIDKGIQ